MILCIFKFLLVLTFLNKIILNRRLRTCNFLRKNLNHKHIKLFNTFGSTTVKSFFFSETLRKYCVYFKCLLENSRNNLPKVHFVMYNL